MVTYRFSPRPDCDENEAIIVWNIAGPSIVKLRSFPLRNPLNPKFQVKAMVTERKGTKELQREIRGRVVSYTPDAYGGYFAIEEGAEIHEGVQMSLVTAMQEPNRMKWSFDGRYLARLSPDKIEVYLLPTMGTYR